MSVCLSFNEQGSRPAATGNQRQQAAQQAREELFKEAMQDDFALVDAEEEDAADGERGNSSGGFVFSAPFGSDSSGTNAPGTRLFGGTTAAPAIPIPVASPPPSLSAKGPFSFGYQTPASAPATESPLTFGYQASIPVNDGDQTPAATASAFQDSKPSATTPKTVSRHIVETVSEKDSPAETSTAAKAAAKPVAAIPDVKDKSAAKQAVPVVKDKKLKVGDRVRVKATGQEGVLHTKGLVQLDGDKKKTRFKHAELERID